MASNKEAGGKKENPRGPSTQEKKVPVRTEAGPDRRPSLNRGDLGRQVEEYLTSIKQELSANRDPNVEVEQTRIQELLDSYKKLVQVYNRRKDIDEKGSEKKEFVIPEIYSVLYPELYNDQREKEKEKLRKSLVKSKPSSDSCVPRNCRLQAKVDLQDPRQKEKDRFVRLVASAPSAFLQGPTRRITPRRVPVSASTSKLRREDTREQEKERLAKILSTSEDGNSGLRKRAASTSAVKKSSSAPSCSARSAPVPASAVSKSTASNSAQPRPVKAPPIRSNKPQDNVVKSGMVRRDVPKRFIPNQPDKQQERRKKLLELKNKEYQEYLDKLQGRVKRSDKCVLARESSLLDLSPAESPRSMKSVATQTDGSADVAIISPPISPHSPSYNIEMAVSNEQSNLFPLVTQKEPFITSPRAKLIKDLHGVSPCLPGASPLLTLPDHAVNDEKKKRSAYAEALKQQIEQKRRLEEEKRRRELEEDEHIERKAREQQQRLNEEWQREQSLRQDWLNQKEAQEETVRQRMVELELEAKELKKRERLRRGTVSPDTPYYPGRQVLSPREVEQLLPQAMRDSMMSSIIHDSNKPRPKTLHFENNNHLLTTATNQNAFITHESRLNDVVNNNEKEVRTPANETSAEPSRPDAEPTADADADTPRADADRPSGETRERPTSPVIPAIQTDSILRRSLYSSPRLQLIQGDSDKEEILRGDKILTQLGVFRRELELEQERLQQRLYEQAST